MLTILFHGCLLTLFAAVIQLFIALPQAPSTPLPPGTDVKGGKSDTAAKPGCLEAESGFMLVTDTKSQHSPEGGDPAEGKPWGNETHFKGGAASPALLSVRGEALLQPGKAGQVAAFIAEPFSLSWMCLPESHWCFIGDLFG